MEIMSFLYVVALGLLISRNGNLAGAQGIGVNYGMKGDNLPTADKVVALYRSRGLTKLRLFDPNPDALAALHGSGIGIILGTLNEDLENLATDPAFAGSWVQTNVVPHAADGASFRYIVVGNEVIPGDLARHALPAMRNLDAALAAVNHAVPVTTAVAMDVLGTSYPPSQATFSGESGEVMASVAAYLETKRVPLLVNVYPYFAYSSDPDHVRLDYALFNATEPVVIDGALKYYNLFDAMVDAMYAALEKAGGGSVEVVVSETGWPSGGGATAATVDNASMYNNKLVKQVGKGTPRRPGKGVEVHIFAMFNENQKPEGTEKNFGLYHPDMTEVYHVDFSA